MQDAGVEGEEEGGKREGQVGESGRVSTACICGGGDQEVGKSRKEYCGGPHTLHMVRRGALHSCMLDSAGIVYVPRLGIDSHIHACTCVCATHGVLHSCMLESVGIVYVP